MSQTPFSVSIEMRDPPNHAITAELDDKPPVVKLPNGSGWEEVPLPKRKSVSIWKAAGLLQLAIPIIFDAPLHAHIAGSFAEAHPVGPAYQTLLHMWRPVVSTDEPPVVQVASPGDIVPYTELDYVVEDLEWGESLADEQGQRIRQHFVVTLKEHNADERLETADEARHRSGKQRLYRVQKRDLVHGLMGIAQRFHVRGGWKALGLLQHPQIHEPKRIKVGQVLVIPTESKVPGGGIIDVGASWTQPVTGG